MMGCLLFLASATGAMACRDPESQVRTFLTLLSDEMLARDFVAKVVVIDTMVNIDNGMRTSSVRVVDPIKGAQQDQVMDIMSHTHSCATDAAVKAGEEYFVSGTIDAHGVFVGEWRGFMAP